MGTHHTLSIFYKGEFVVVQAGSHDGFIEHQGAAILEFLLVPGNIQRLKDGLEFITVVDFNTAWEIEAEHYKWIRVKKDREDISDDDDDGDKYQEVCRCGAAMRNHNFYSCPNLPRSLDPIYSSSVLEAVASAGKDDFVPIHLDFGAIGSDYNYCIDLDAEVFEAFLGGTFYYDEDKIGKAEPIGQYRFTRLFPDNAGGPRLLKSFPFSQLPVNRDDLVVQVDEHGRSDSDSYSDKDD